MKTEVVQTRVNPELREMIDDAATRTGLSKSEVMRQGLRKGLPKVVEALGQKPKKTLLDALRELKGIEIPKRKYRFKPPTRVTS